MSSTLERSPRPLVFAHRGGSALAPENTLAAFDEGLSRGADGLELDVHLSRDGRVVVHHDTTLDRTTSATGPIAARGADELAGVDAGYRFERDGAFPFRGRGIGLPLLGDVLRRYTDARLIVELKGNSTALAAAVVEEIRAAEALDRATVGSFAGGALREVRRLEPRLPTSAARAEVRWALYQSRIGWPIRRPPYHAFLVPEHQGRTRIVSPRFIRAAHRGGVAIQVWTVDDPDDIRRLLAWGVDAIVTDRPDVAVPIVRKWAGP